MKDNSYSELMKAAVMNRQKAEKQFVLDLYIDMVINEAILKREKEKLARKIDQAIDDGDKEAFMNLSIQYKQLKCKFGT